ncbi:NAD-dependent epimerase/dehydratase family protein [Hydrogenophaga palleronii]|uniref:NAD-dependent epimerase/dehydratase family protein n=1 Tax=Hydrogenophaga palleronii TaxID=65655 RepID=UPI000825AEFA|nr:NAD-dependent epimerase/dehydratase family protein [Hydrogenophaga palleronii]
MPATSPSSSPAGTVLVLGGRGRFGLAAVQAFARDGWRVLAQMRPGAQAPAAVRGVSDVQWLAQAMDTPQAIAALVARVREAGGAAVVVHALNPNRYTRPAWEREARPLLQGGMAVAQALGATLMLPGNVYNFGQQMPAVLVEGAPQHPTVAMGRIRNEMEALLEAATQRGELRAVIVRAGNFYGQGQGTWLDLSMLKEIRRGQLVFPGPLDVATPWAYLPDLAQTFAAVARVRDALPAFETLHFRGHTLSGHDWVNALQPLAREQGWLREGAALRVKSLPWPLIRAMGLVMPSFEALAALRYLWNQPHRLDNRRLLALIGSEPHTAWPVALRHSLQEMALLSPAPTEAVAPSSARA